MPNRKPLHQTNNKPLPVATDPPSGRRKRTAKPEKDKSLETWIWDAACSIRGTKDAPKYKDYILPTRHIHTSDADPSAAVPQSGMKVETYRPIPEIVAELDAIEKAAAETDKALRSILKQIGV